MSYEYCRISPDDFWYYTPADLDLMLTIAIEERKRVEKIEYYHAYREAFLCSILTNVYRDRDKLPEPVSLYDFMPEYPRTEEKPPERTVMTDEEIESTLKNFVYPILKAGER